jgi:gliding motility-associated-like protein
MGKRLFTGWLIAVVLICMQANTLSAQVILLSTETKGLFSVDMGNNFKVEKLSAVKDWNIGSIALCRDSFYFVDRTTNHLHSAILDPVNPINIDLEQTASGGNLNTLTVDRGGALWGMQSTIRYMRSNVGGNFFPFFLTMIPFTATGDLIFYKDKMYLSADEGIVEISADFHFTSSLIIPTNGRVFAGLVNVSAHCEGNKVYGVETVGTTTHLVEIDIDNKKILGTYGSFSLDGDKVLDAASFNETGEQPFMQVAQVNVTPICFPETDTKISLRAYTSAGDTGITYTMTLGTEKKVVSPRRGPVTFNEPITPGAWHLHIESSSGCTVDTPLIVLPPGKVVAAIEAVRPDTCGMANGVVIVKTTEGQPPFSFEIAGIPVNASPVISGLPAGNYKLQVTDKTHCNAGELPFTIGVYSAPDPIIDLTIVPGSVCARNGEIKVWYRSSAAVDSSRLDNEKFGTKDHFTGLWPGAHKLQIRTGNCVYDTTIVVPVSTATPVIDSSITHNICLGTGSIKVVISGAEKPYRFEVAGGLYNSGIEIKNLPAGMYPVKIFNAAKCLVDSFQFRIKEKGDCDTLQAIYVPSAFTPNGDGKNDVLKPLKNPLGKVAHFVFRIYNRLGQVLFESNTVSTGWDGTCKNVPQPVGTYIWMFEAIASDGKRLFFSGTTVLIR